MPDIRKDLAAAAIQCVGELDRGLTIAELEAKAGRLADCRQTLKTCRELVRILDRTIPKGVA